VTPSAPAARHQAGTFCGIANDELLGRRVRHQRVGERRHAGVERAARFAERLVRLHHQGKLHQVEAADPYQGAGARLGRGRGRMHGRDDGLRQPHDLLHHLAARRHHLHEERAAAIGIGAPRRHFLEIVSRREGRAVRRQHHGADRAIACDRIEGFGQRNDHRG